MTLFVVFLIFAFLTLFLRRIGFTKKFDDFMNAHPVFSFLYSAFIFFGAIGLFIYWVATS